MADQLSCDSIDPHEPTLPFINKEQHISHPIRLRRTTHTSEEAFMEPTKLGQEEACKPEILA